MIGPIEILVFLLVLGVLVFVHELGHFAAAKMCNIYVDRFSLGMPPRIFGFRYGETDYCVGLLPIGGYVKMAGQEDAPLSEEEREETYGHIAEDRWYNNKPIWQRAFVLVAGPAMNIVLALLIYGFMAGYGRDVPLASIDTRIGFVEDGSPASEAPMYLAANGSEFDRSGAGDAQGWKTGDRIVSIDGKHIETFQDIVIAAVLGEGKEALVEIERPVIEGDPVRYLSPIEPQVIDEDIKAARYGVAPFHTALIRHLLPGSPAKKQGLLPGDVVLSANGEIVDQGTFSSTIRELPDGGDIDLRIRRDGEVQELTMLTRREGRIEGIQFEPNLHALIGVGDDGPQEIASENESALDGLDLQAGDKVVSVRRDPEVGSAVRELIESGVVDEITVSVERARPFFAVLGEAQVDEISLTPSELFRALTGVQDEAVPKIAYISDELSESSGLKRRDVVAEIEGQPATVALLRELEDTRAGETISITVERPDLAGGLLQDAETFEADLKVSAIQQIGVVWGMETIHRREPASGIIPFAFAESYRNVAQIGQVLKGLFTGSLSPELLGGPVMIGDVVMTAYDVGIFYLLEITAMISVNLAVFNLLPLPVLDGGQLMFLLIEAVRRRPVSVKVMETVQQVGFFFIIGLLLYVTFNDVTRIFDRWLN